MQKLIKDIIYTLLKLLIAIIVIYLLKDISKKDHHYNSYYELLGIQYFFGSTAISECIRNIYNVFNKHLFKTKEDRIVEQYFNKLQLNCIFYSTIFDILSYCKYLSNKLKHIDQKENSQEFKILNSLFNDLEFLFTFSTNNTFNITDKYCSLGKLIKDIDRFLDNYGSSKVNIKNSVIIPFLHNMSNTKIKSVISPILLYGNPGTGKTKFVEDLANLLNVKIVKTKPNSKCYYDYSKGIEKEKLCEYTIGIYESINQYGHDFIIVFIDEIDKKLFKIIDNKIVPDFTFLEELLIMFNGNKKIYDYYLRGDLNINNVLIISASNLSLSELTNKHESFKPLEGRMIQINIPDIMPDIKKKILAERMAINVFNNKIEYLFIEKLVKEIEDPGVRTLIKILDMYINKINSLEFLKDTIWYEHDLSIFTNELFSKTITNDTDVIKV